MPSPTTVKKLEVIANISVIVASIFLSIILAKNYLFPGNHQAPGNVKLPVASASNGPANDRLQPGLGFSLPGVAWNRSDHTLVLALSTNCRFCSESAPLYHQILKQRRSGTRIVAVLPQSIEDSDSYLNKLGISVDQVVQAPLGLIGVAGTPTLILVGSNGTVVDSWRGKLASTKEEEVIRQIR